ncbi:hypothetical protein GCM10011514_33860 [Emticicia aquatilis]|uniref:Secretion system C-terminal sorting domain-containing protein n=1 Tax=Emticicia aquatilis TaxID=1537369 RepID=A0A916YY22_9BACT|nr:SGNH/GDSL hydrolase family protein [Emticicia aquatilis]GGD67030.1 hypothetical protein GCM10011514_33860 [Emticicia aquatilis]
MKNKIKIALFVLFSFLSVSLSAQTPNYPLKVAILGNSITQHGPLPANGWNGNWGMAASAEEFDYVHLLIKDLKTISTGIEVSYLNIAGFESGYNKNYNINNDALNYIKNQKPDIILFRIGDNMSDLQIDLVDFPKAMTALVKYLTTNQPNAKIIFTNSFWTNAYRDYVIQSYASDNGHRFIDLKGLFDISENTAAATYKDSFISRHPSDKGMKAIEERIWKGMKIDVEDLICKYYGKCNYCQEGSHTGYLDEGSCDTIWGWAFDEQNLERTVQVDILVDDKPFISLLANEARPDVQKVFGTKALNHGFRYTVPAGVWWKDGQKHIITARPCWKDAKYLNWSGKEVKCSKPEEVKNEVPSYVADWLSTECDEIIGWAYDKNNLTKTLKVDFLLNDKIMQTLDANVQRTDLLQQLISNPDAAKHVFVAKFPPLSLGNYNAQIRLAGTTTIIGNTNNFQCPKVVSAVENSDLDVSVYPNPNQGGFNLKIPNEYQKYEIALFDSFGKNIPITQKEDNITINNISTGIYLLKINVNGKIITRKVVIN